MYFCRNLTPAILIAAAHFTEKWGWSAGEKKHIHSTLKLNAHLSYSDTSVRNASDTTKMSSAQASARTQIYVPIRF